MNTARADKPTDGNPSQAAAIRVAATLLVGGSLHFIAPRFFDSIIPPMLPGRPRIYTYVSGITALGIGTGLSIARTRRVSADLASAYFIAVTPAKIQMAVDWCRSDTKRLPAKISGIAQVLGQIPLVTEARKARRNAVSTGGVTLNHPTLRRR